MVILEALNRLSKRISIISPFDGKVNDILG